MMPLIVDDDPAIREIFTLFISREGHTPRSAANGQEALELLERQRPDLIVLDIMMQPMDGWETLTAIRNNPSMRDLPVTMFSGKPPSQTDLLRYGGWIDDYLMKPLDFKDLSTFLTNLLDRSRKEGDAARIARQAGADPLLAEEYTALRRKLFLYRKFSSTISGEEYDTAIRLQEERLRQVRDLLTGTVPRPG